MNEQKYVRTNEQSNERTDGRTNNILSFNKQWLQWRLYFEFWLLNESIYTFLKWNQVVQKNNKTQKTIKTHKHHNNIEQ